MSRVAVIILNWNGEKLLKEFLPSVLRYTPEDSGRVVVVDNHSDDRSLQVLREFFPQVEVVCFDRNYGFAGGYNRAIEQIEAEYVVLLNSDVEVTSGWLEPLVALLDQDASIAAVQPKIKACKDRTKFEYAGACGGYMDRVGFPFCRGRILDMTETDSGQYDEMTDVFWCSGAALCIRRDVYLRCGGLDERFFAHMEEIDLCWRIRNKGGVLKVQPLSVVYHLGGGSLPMKHPRKLFLNYRNNLLMLYKNLPAGRYRKIMACRVFFDMAAMLAFLLKGEISNLRSVLAAYRSFWKMRKEYTHALKNVEDECIYPKSIVYAFFVRKVVAFSQLHWL